MTTAKIVVKVVGINIQIDNIATKNSKNVYSVLLPKKTCKPSSQGIGKICIMLNTTKKITSYKELEGVKMRVGGGVANAIGTALGIAGVNAPAPKVYEIISGGVADGVMFPFETMHAFKIAELAKYSLSNPDGMYTTAFAVIMNNDTYNDLSASHKKCIDDMRGVSLSRKIGNYWDQADEVGKASAAEYNHELTIANNDERQYFKAKMGPVIDDVLAKINAVGVDASGALSYFKEEVKVENLLSGN